MISDSVQDLIEHIRHVVATQGEATVRAHLNASLSEKTLCWGIGLNDFEKDLLEASPIEQGWITILSQTSTSDAAVQGFHACISEIEYEDSEDEGLHTYRDPGEDDDDDEDDDDEDDDDDDDGYDSGRQLGFIEDDENSYSDSELEMLYYGDQGDDLSEDEPCP
jgi:hypothetical protein